jgi:predicted enzyme related to lactoylglutathione lyase
MSGGPLASKGVYEFIFGGQQDQRDALLGFWSVLGFEPIDEGHLSAEEASVLYGHASALTSIRLKHPGCDTFNTGYVRLQLWNELRNDGLGLARSIETGSRWMGMYTHDVLQVRDSFASLASQKKWQMWVSPLVAAPLMKPAPEHDFFEPFVGLREQLVFSPDFRLAFIQRAGFDRPGFGTFDDSLAYKNTEGSHANIVQPDNQFSTDFYKSVFGFETAPFGDPHDSGDEESTIAVLNLKPEEMFRIERTRAVDCPSGLLQVYSSFTPGDDLRDSSRAGSANLCLYSIQVSDIDQLADKVNQNGGQVRCGPATDEFGIQTVYFDAPDGYSWLAVVDVA